jgi:hypothetical protein
LGYGGEARRRFKPISAQLLALEALRKKGLLLIVRQRTNHTSNGYETITKAPRLGLEWRTKKMTKKITRAMGNHGRMKSSQRTKDILIP